jgi:hypothetical protein
VGRKNSSAALLWAPAAVVAGAGVLALIAAMGSRSGAPPEQPLTNTPIDWFGGVIRKNVDALGFLFASENETGSHLLWALQAIAANNFARNLARSRPQIRSIADMLQSGVNKQTRRRFYELGWGPQYDRQTRITRWAATSKGSMPMQVSWRYLEFAERLIRNQIDLSALTGKRGERLPGAQQLRRMSSFLQYEGFAETVQRQAGTDAESNPDVVVQSWGQPRLLASVEGVRFYG